MVSLGLVISATLLGCRPGAEEVSPLPVMSPAERLTRLSLDLRGRRPSPDELDEAEGGEASIEALTERFLEDPAFEERMADLWSEVLLTRAESFYVGADAYGLADGPGFAASVGEEPLRLIARVAAQDLPWTEVVTGDWTMADDNLLAAWPLQAEASGSGWREARYTDGRPEAGILATNGLWWRYTTTTSNANRGRANQISRILLCNDYLVRPIEFERNVDLLDESAVLDAISNNPGCVGCHASLDPIASYLYGFWTYVPDSVEEVSRYHPEREPLWNSVTGVAPAWYGEPGDSLADLGRQIAADPRFPDCAVQRGFELLLRRTAAPGDIERLARHREAFLDGGLTQRALLRSLVRDEFYTAGATDAEGAVPRKLVTVELLVSQVEALTGFRWTYAGYDMLRTDAIGLRTLAGGADGLTVSASAREPNATLVLVQERLAEAAAWALVAEESARAAADRRLFDRVDLAALPSAQPAATEAQLVQLYRQVLGKAVAPGGEEVEAARSLLAELEALGSSPAEAWAGLLSAMLRDPDFLFY